MREPVIVGGEPVHVAVSDAAQRALAAVLANHVDEIDAALEPFGLRAVDVAVPTFTRYLFVDEVRRR